VKGLIVNYGTASGPVGPLSLQDLHGRSLSVCRPTLRNWIATPQALQQASDDVFDMMRNGVLSMPVDRVLDLSEAAEAHRMLASRNTTGAVILRP
jgi:NADPH2:quinone reductase